MHVPVGVRLMYVYRQTDPNCWTVGYYGPEGWEEESHHEFQEDAARRVHFLNGGSGCKEQFELD